MALDADALARLEDRFSKAQAGTRAPIEGVIVAASGQYESSALAWALAAALLAPLPLILLTHWSTWRIFTLQLLIALVLTALSLAPHVSALLTGLRAKRLNVHRAALAQFVVRGLDRAPRDEGVLIYVSLAERMARIQAGEGALAVVPMARWQSLIDALVRRIAAGELEGALSEAADGAGKLLGAALPVDPAAAPRPRRHFHAI
jgi:putative membrane protein